MPSLADREMDMKHTWTAVRTFLGCVMVLGAWAVRSSAGPGDQPTPTDKFKNLEFREIGPATMGGRIDDFAVVESNPNIVYVGTASGGVWKTTNNGTTWEPIFDKESVSTIGDIAIAPSDPAVVWVGTGEPNNRQSSSWGDGAHRANRDSSKESGCGVRSSSGTFVGRESGARSLQDDGWREDMVASAEDQRRHRRERHRHGSAKSGHFVCRGIRAPPDALWIQWRRARQRNL